MTRMVGVFGFAERFVLGPDGPVVHGGSAEALSVQLFGRDVVLNIVARQRDTDPPRPVASPTALALTIEPAADRAPVTTGCAIRRRPRKSGVERHEIIAPMGQLKLAGMRAAYDEVIAAGLRAQHPVQRIIGELPLAQLADHRARSIAYGMGVARFPVTKYLAEFDFTVSPINQGLVRELHEGGFLATQRNAVLIGGTGTGKSHVSIAIGANCVRNGARGRFAVYLVNQTRGRGACRQARTARRPARSHRSRHPRRAWLSAVPDQWRPDAVPSDQPPLRAHLDHPVDQSRFCRMAERLW